MKLIETRRDLSVWIIAIIWFIVNFGAMMIWGNIALVITNPVCLILLTAFVFYSKSNKRLNDYLNEKI
jgi:hypothetical protein